MKKLKIVLSILLLSAMSLVAQEKAPKWITDKCSAMKTQITTDLQLTADEANTFEKIMIDKYVTDAAKVKEMTTDEEKKAYYAEAYKTFMTTLKSNFSDEKATAIQKWTKENHAKFNKPKN